MLIVIVAVAVVLPAMGITEAGTTLQVASVMLAGTVHVKVAPWLYPLSSVNVRVVIALWPAAMLRVVGVVEKPKSAPTAMLGPEVRVEAR